jgi:putative sterol carrier protein
VVTVSSFGGFDPDRALEKLRKLAADAPAYMADGFGRMVHNAPPERLEQLMRSPARKPALDGIFWQMPKQVNPAVAKDMTTTIRWRITGRPDDGVDVYQLEVDKGQVKTVKGESGDPKLTVTMDAVEFLKLASGNLDPMQAYFKGRIELTGDIMVAAKLAQLFKMPGGSRAGSSETSGNDDSAYEDPPEDGPTDGPTDGPSDGPDGPTPFSPPPAG